MHCVTECHGIPQLSRKHHRSSKYLFLFADKLKTHVSTRLCKTSAITWYSAYECMNVCMYTVDPTWKTLAQSHIFPFNSCFHLFHISVCLTFLGLVPPNVSAFWSFCLLVTDSNMHPPSSSHSHYNQRCCCARSASRASGKLTSWILFLKTYLPFTAP